MRSRTAALLLLAGAACAPEVPAEPTWIADVRPILAANCIRCHSPPQIGAARNNFRLDKYDDELIADTEFDLDTQPDLIFGAASMSANVLTVLENQEMPPRFPLTDRQIDVIRAWLAAAGADFPPRGEPRQDNAPPQMSLVGDPAVSPGRIRIDYAIEDPDGDVVTGGVTTVAQAAEVMPVLYSNQLFAGRGSVVFEVESGTHDLVALLDDGNQVVEVDLATVEVP